MADRVYVVLGIANSLHHLVLGELGALGTG